MTIAARHILTPGFAGKRTSPTHGLSGIGRWLFRQIQRTLKSGLSFLGAAGVVLAAVLWIVNDVSLAAVSNMHMPSPQALYEQAVRDAEPKGKGTGESFC